MNTKTFFSALIILLFACSKPTTSNEVANGLRGAEYLMLKEVKGYESFSSFTSVVLDVNNQFMLSHYKNDSSDLFVLEGIKIQADKTYKTVALDFLQFNTAELGDNFVVGGNCKVGTEEDSQLIGMFSMNAPTEGDASIASKVWRADHTTGKIIPIELKGVLFYNEIND